MRDRAATERRQDLDVIGHAHFLPRAARVLAPRHRDLGQRVDPARRTEPSHQRFVPDAHGHDVEAAEHGVLPPVERLLGVDEASLVGLDLDGEHFADIPLGQDLLERRIHFQGVRRRDELLDQLGRSARGLEHASRLGDVHGHARLAEHVLALLENRPRDLAVGVGPGADADRVDVRGPDELTPIAVDARDAELLRGLFARCFRPVCHRRQLHPGLSAELGNVMLA